MFCHHHSECPSRHDENDGFMQTVFNPSFDPNMCLSMLLTEELKQCGLLYFTFVIAVKRNLIDDVLKIVNVFY